MPQKGRVHAAGAAHGQTGSSAGVPQSCPWVGLGLGRWNGPTDYSGAPLNTMHVRRHLLSSIQRLSDCCLIHNITCLRQTIVNGGLTAYVVAVCSVDTAASMLVYDGVEGHSWRAEVRRWMSNRLNGRRCCDALQLRARKHGLDQYWRWMMQQQRRQQEGGQQAPSTITATSSATETQCIIDWLPLMWTSHNNQKWEVACPMLTML